MKKIAAVVFGIMLSGCAVGSNVNSAAEQDATEQRAKQFLADTSPRAMNGHPKAEDNIVDKQIYSGKKTGNEDPDHSDYIEETE